jgi:hypothetical protein
VWQCPRLVGGGERGGGERGGGEGIEKLDSVRKWV